MDTALIIAVSASLSTAVTAGGFYLFLIKGQSAKVDRLEKEKVAQLLCDSRHAQIAIDLKKGDEKFKDLTREIRDLIKEMAELSTSLKMWIDYSKAKERAKGEIEI